MTPPPTGAHVECDENGFPVSPLRDQEDLWFVQAASLYRPLAKSVGVARASGLLLILSGLATMVVAAPTKSILGLGLGFAVLVLGILERKAGNDLSQVKRGAPFRLALHQVVLFGLIAGSCWMSMQAVHEQAALALEQASADQHLSDLELQQVEMAGSLIPKMISAWFNVVIAAFAVIHGGLALYYLTRSRRIRMFHNELPPWVTDIVKTLMAR